MSSSGEIILTHNEIIRKELGTTCDLCKKKVDTGDHFRDLQY